MKLSDVKIDPVKMEQGDWVDNIPELQGVRVKVRGANNRDWRKLQGRLVDAVPRKNKVGGRLNPDDLDRITSILLRDTSLLDWDGIEAEDGSPLVFSKDEANRLLTNPEFGKFRDGVLWAANVVAEQEAEGVDTTSKN